MGGEGERRGLVRSHSDLEVYQRAFELAMELFELSRTFPREETYSLTDQIRRSTRSVCTNLAEAWRKRRYEAAFVAKLSDAETEMAETQVWIQFATKCGYIERDAATSLYRRYDQAIGMIVGLIRNPKPWLLPRGETQ